MTNWLIPAFLFVVGAVVGVVVGVVVVSLHYGFLIKIHCLASFAPPIL